MSSNICVAVRKRPVPNDDKDVVNAASSQSLIVNEPKVKYDMSKYTQKHQFVFDEVMNEKANNREVYMRCAAPLIETVFNRGNATCFAYGQTGSGKTHTMLGKKGEPGLYACAAHDVFVRAKAEGMAVYASFYEIYGRKLFDLLNDKATMVAREDANAQIVICGLTEHAVSNVEELLRIIAAGSEGRAAGQTSANSESSRSHAVLQLEVRENPSQKLVGRMSFIDLAGNERGSDTFNCDRKTRMEGAEINKSLLALKECIRALGMGKNHVPFRGSVLTEVLRDSFLGNSRTTMIATISSASTNCEHTLNTLRYTQRVKDLGGKGEVPVIRERVPDPKPQRRREAAAPIAAAGGGDYAAMAARISSDADPVSGPSGGGMVQPPAARPKAGKAAAPPRRPAPQRPQWIDDFQAGGGGGGQAGEDSDAEGARQSQRDESPVEAPAVEAIIQNHLDDLDEVDEAADDDDDEEDEEMDPLPAVAGNAKAPLNPLLASAKKAKAVHAHIVDAIRQMQEQIIVRHRGHVDTKNQLAKQEVVAIQRLDSTDNIDEYVSKVDAVLAKQQREITAMRAEMARVKKYLKEEEVLSQSLTPQARRRA